MLKFNVIKLRKKGCSLMNEGDLFHRAKSMSPDFLRRYLFIQFSILILANRLKSL
jgi:hypothetical protein